MKLRGILMAILLFAVISASHAQDKIHTCINEKGEKLFSVKATYVGPFSDGMAEVNRIVLVDNQPYYRSGFVDEKGNLVIEVKYEKVMPFGYGVAWVKEPGAKEFFLINKKGERLTQQTWKRVGYFREGFCDVYDAEGRMGFINRRGELVIPCIYLGDAFSEGLACVTPYDSKEETYGFIDTTGQVVIPFQYRQAGTASFRNGECRAVIKGYTCLINRKGDVVFKPTLTANCSGFSNGLSACYTNYKNRSEWGYYNRKNEWVIQPVYDYADIFNEGLAIVQKAGKYGVIDTTEKIIIPMEYANIFGYPADDGFFGLEKVENGEKEYMNAEGKPFTTTPIKYLFSSNKHKLVAYCDKEDKYGYMDLNGTVFINAQFEKTSSFHEGKAWIVGNTTSIKKAAGITDAAFVKEYTVGEKVYARRMGKGEFYKGSVSEVNEYYYLILFENNTQEWVSFDHLKR